MAAEAGRHQIDAPFLGVVDGSEGIVLREVPRVHCREGMALSRTGVEPARNREQAVADLLRIEAATVEPPEQRVGRIDGGAGVAGPT